ncbi:2-acetamido-2-deoxy-D-galactose-binding seed lectin 2-like [Cryptomeria japonica]|uniref:2-acetamido-2-deoxy-D-galactose-binding seed lectin 2-like n=1 Tax=Cryptomeria japonica TaxID=3369 RepID=UPI0027DA095B|nr:2-acetamido-2-deoxy-D-galactose-binding seed lectin 2-like [Cryptomeria japonica]
MACAGNIRFAFPPQTEDINVEEDAEFEGDKIQLTINQEWSGGRAIYNKPVPQWDKSSWALANFTSYFQFVIGNTTDLFGDGLAFFMAPFDSKIPENSKGEWLGLFNETTNGGFSNRVVAVEFDTYKNDHDPDGNHVGIDVNSITSVKQVSLSSEREFLSNTLNNGTITWDAWVDYDGSTKQLQVFLLFTDSSSDLNVISKPTSPILTYHIDLRQYIPEMIGVGISASTGTYYETHTVKAWNFSCAYSWDISSPPPASNIPSSSPPHTNSSIPPSNIPSSVPSDKVSSPSRTQNSSQKIILLSLVCLVGILCLLVIAVWCYFKKRATRPDNPGEEGDRELDGQFAQGQKCVLGLKFQCKAGGFWSSKRGRT